MQNDSIGVILAAGEGKRMGGDLPKSLMNIGGQSVLERLAQVIQEVTGNKAIAVVGHGKEEIKKIFGDSLIYVTQEEQLGTAHALLQAKEVCTGAKRIAVFYGDHPFISSQTIKRLLEKSEQNGAEITLATAVVPNFENKYKIFLNFGRVVRENGKIKNICEYKDASENEKNIREVNPGYYVFDAKWLWPHLEKVGNNNAQGEYYLTDLLHMAQNEGVKITSIGIPPQEALGANSKEELEILERFIVQ